MEEDEEEDDDAKVATAGSSSMSPPTAAAARSKVKRAKPKKKIKRTRHITSCWQCREKKQKCDRAKPVCGNCKNSNSRDGMCLYANNAALIGSDETAERESK